MSRVKSNQNNYNERTDKVICKGGFAPKIVCLKHNVCMYYLLDRVKSNSYILRPLHCAGLMMADGMMGWLDGWLVETIRRVILTFICLVRVLN